MPTWQYSTSVSAGAQRRCPWRFRERKKTTFSPPPRSCSAARPLLAQVLMQDGRFQQILLELLLVEWQGRSSASCVFVLRFSAVSRPPRAGSGVACKLSGLERASACSPSFGEQSLP